MKRVAVLLTLTVLSGAVVGAGLGGCTDPIAAEQDTVKTYPQVTMTEYWLRDWTRVEQPIVHPVGSGQTQVAVPIRNLTNDPLSLDYQYRFLRDGAEVEGVSGWHHIVLPSRGKEQITFTSMVTTANDFNVVIRRSQ